MTETNEDLLNGAIEDQIERLNRLSPDDETFTEVVDTIVKLQKLDNEKEKSRLDYDKHYYDNELNKQKLEVEKGLKDKENELKASELEIKKLECDIKRDQLEHDKKAGYIRTGVEVFGIILPAVLYTRLFKAGLKFETEGTVTSSMFRNLIGKLKPTKR